MNELSNNIINIIKRYNDISLENLKRIQNNTKYKEKYYVIDSVMDLIVKCYQLGFIGFI